MSLIPTKQTILIIDDELNLRQTLALILQKAGYNVTTAGNGQEGRQYVQAGPFDLVFLDLKMPDMGGLELLLELRNLYPDMPVLILTAHATLESAIDAVRLGARDYLLKPIDPEQIIIRVQQVLADSEQIWRRRRIITELQDLLLELNQMVSQESGVHPTTGTPALDSSRFLQRGPFTLDLHTRHVVLGDRAISFSPTAFDYLATLIRHSPNPVSYETLVLEAQGYTTTSLEARDLARWRIHELRKVLEEDQRQPQFIITVRGVGYRFVI